MAFGNYSGFSPLNFDSANRAQVQTGYVQQPAASGGGGWLGNLLGLAGTITSFIPGAQVASPFLTGAGQVLNGDLTGGAQTAAAGAVQSTQPQGGQANMGEKVNPPENPEPTNQNETPEQDPQQGYVDPAFSTPQEYQQYMHQLYLQNPYLLMAQLGGGYQMPGVGFNQFNSGVM